MKSLALYSNETSFIEEFSNKGLHHLKSEDPEIYSLLELEHQRQVSSLSMIASSSIANPSVLACEGLFLTNVTMEGYPGRRFHAGCKYIDAIERVAIERAKSTFDAHYVNVQPHSGSSANQIVMFSILQPGDCILGLDLDCGGHLTHGSRASFSGQFFESITYGLDENGRINYKQVLELAKKHKPRLIICGASAYTRIIDFKRFRAIVDEVGHFYSSH